MAYDPDSKRLDAGDRFPRMPIHLIRGETLTLPDDLAGRWGVVLFYRGHW